MRFIFATALLAYIAAAEQEFLTEEDFAVEGRELEDEDLMNDINQGRQLWHKERQTFRNGKNRRYGLNSSRYYKLQTSIQLTHDGLRSPTESETFTNPISDPAFSDTNTLTQEGADAAYAFGQNVADCWSDNSDWVDFSALDPLEVYMHSNADALSQGSMTSNALGAFGGTAPTVPVGTLTDLNASANITSGLMLDASNQCARSGLIATAITDDTDTQAMFDKVTEYLEDQGYFDKLRDELGESGATAEQLYKAAREIDWARKNGYTLELDLSAEDLRYNDLAVERSNYLNLAAAKDQSFMNTWQLQQFMIEVSRISRGDLELGEAPIINEYWPDSLVADAENPKLYMLSADDTLMQSLLGVFNNLYLDSANSTSSFWIDFYECQWNCYWYDKTKVEVIYCPDGSDLKESCTILNYDRWAQDYRGAARSYDFEKWLAKGLKYQDYSNGFPSTEVDDVCAEEYDQKRSFNSPDRFYTDLLKDNGFNPYSHSHGNSHSHDFFDFDSHFHW